MHAACTKLDLNCAMHKTCYNQVSMILLQCEQSCGKCNLSFYRIMLNARVFRSFASSTCNSCRFATLSLGGIHTTHNNFIIFFYSNCSLILALGSLSELSFHCCRKRVNTVHWEWGNEHWVSERACSSHRVRVNSETKTNSIATKNNKKDRLTHRSFQNNHISQAQTFVSTTSVCQIHNGGRAWLVASQ